MTILAIPANRMTESLLSLNMFYIRTPYDTWRVQYGMCEWGGRGSNNHQRLRPKARCTRDFTILIRNSPSLSLIHLPQFFFLIFSGISVFKILFFLSPQRICTLVGPSFTEVQTFRTLIRLVIAGFVDYAPHFCTYHTARAHENTWDASNEVALQHSCSAWQRQHRQHRYLWLGLVVDESNCVRHQMGHYFWHHLPLPALLSYRLHPCKEKVEQRTASAVISPSMSFTKYWGPV